jgi:hypothetical protein
MFPDSLLVTSRGVSGITCYQPTFFESKQLKMSDRYHPPGRPAADLTGTGRHRENHDTKNIACDRPKLVKMTTRGILMLYTIATYVVMVYICCI